VSVAAEAFGKDGTTKPPRRTRYNRSARAIPIGVRNRSHQIQLIARLRFPIKSANDVIVWLLPSSPAAITTRNSRWSAETETAVANREKLAKPEGSMVSETGRVATTI
jgi:hypothetical protein